MSAYAEDSSSLLTEKKEKKENSNEKKSLYMFNNACFIIDATLITPAGRTGPIFNAVMLNIGNIELYLIYSAEQAD